MGTWFLGMLVLGACDKPVEDTSTEADTDTDSDTDTDTDSDTDTDTDTDSDTDTDTGPHTAATLSSFGGGGSTIAHLTWEYVEKDCPTDCSKNTAPVLDAPLFLVNGVVQAKPPAVAGDLAAVLVGYSDGECNLHCGAGYYSLTGPEDSFADAGSLPSNLPCDTASSSVYLGFDIGAVESGSYSYSVKVDDACGGSSGRIEGGFAIP